MFTSRATRIIVYDNFPYFLTTDILNFNYLTINTKTHLF